MSEHWFGKNWGAPACDPNYHVSTPVGVACMYCREPIILGDRGMMQTVVHGASEDGAVRATLEPAHLHCFLKRIRPHGPECPHCRGKELCEHAEDCQRNVKGYCTCLPIPPGQNASNQTPGRAG